jgi:hypothetical protein
MTAMENIRKEIMLTVRGRLNIDAIRMLNVDIDNK